MPLAWGECFKLNPSMTINWSNRLRKHVQSNTWSEIQNERT